MARAHSLIEVAISASVLALIVGATATLSATIQRTASAAAVQSDLQRDARRVLAQIRSELRQSGWDGGENLVTAPSATGVSASTLTFKVRTGLAPGEWSSSITYRLAADGVYSDAAGTPARYRLVRESDGETVDLAANVTAFACVRESGSDTVRVVLTFMGRGDAIDDVILSSHTDEIMLLNPQSAQ